LVAAAVAIEGGDLPLAGGLLALVRPAIAALAPGGVLAVLSSAPSLHHDLPGWCRLERLEYLGCEAGPDTRDRHLVRRPEKNDRSHRLLNTAQDPPERADPATGFAPRGVRVEAGGPAYPFVINDRDHGLPPEVGELYRQAVAAQWDLERDIPWARAEKLPPALTRALAQVMTFLAENELSALYVPARFLPRLHPAYVETAQFLATQLGDEARHIEVFLRRARLCGTEQAISSATTSRSLHFLLALEDFTEAAFLLSVLGEGTFLDLLRFVQRHAPDEATVELVRRARADETRHVHFGQAHIRHALAHDPTLAGRLEAAVRRRAATMADAGGVPAPLADALVVLAAGGDDPAAIARGHEAFRELLTEMAQGRIKRLVAAGFDGAGAQLLSDLHTPNFM
jgi:TusA-related sulfurtransferase